MSECVTLAPEQKQEVAELRRKREETNAAKRAKRAEAPPKPPVKAVCAVCKIEFDKRGSRTACSPECSWKRKQAYRRWYEQAYYGELKRTVKQQPVDESVVTKRQRSAVIQAARRYERCRAEWGRCKSREDVASIRSELDAAEHALALALSRQGLRVATVNGLRYRVDAVGELVRQEVVRAIHRSESTKTQKPAQEANRA